MHSLLHPEVNDPLFTKGEVCVNEFHVLVLLVTAEDLSHLEEDCSLCFHYLRSVNWLDILHWRTLSLFVL